MADQVKCTRSVFIKASLLNKSSTEPHLWHSAPSEMDTFCRVKSDQSAWGDFPRGLNAFYFIYLYIYL